MTIRKTFKFETAHRVRDAYTERCRGIHGHSYTAELFLVGTQYDRAEMIMDFKLVKDKFNDFIDSFDHTLLIEHTDKFLVKNAKELNDRYMIVPYNSTAEKMSQHIYNEAQIKGLPVCKVIIHETLTGCAICESYDEIVDNSKVIFSDQIKAEWKNEH